VIIRKLHGWGNDFLVVLDSEQPAGPVEPGVLPGLAGRLCDRRRGIGADGLLHGAAGSDGADVVMSLHNADSSRAEMSGNGIRCLAHAVVLADGTWRDQVVIDSDVGRRTLTLRPVGTTEPAPGAEAGPGDAVPVAVEVSVPMGVVGPGRPENAPTDDLAGVLGSRRHVLLDVGNPHLVVEVDDPESVPLDQLGPEAEALFPHGVNVEVVTLEEPDAVRLRVWERGVGLTEACGTGACAAAVAARQWGLESDHLAVAMPGGTATVVVDGDRVMLVGPSVLVGTIEVADA
jgi:diaminopimelate epimerase